MCLRGLIARSGLFNMQNLVPSYCYCKIWKQMKIFMKFKGNRLNIWFSLVLNDILSLMQIYGKLANHGRAVTEYSVKEQKGNVS